MRASSSPGPLTSSSATSTGPSPTAPSASGWNSTLCYEYPEAYEPGRNEPYYPVPREENEERYRLYLEEAKKLKGVYFAGRLGDYRYYNMDQAVARALKLFEEIVHE